jgi:hypothetical protein
MHIKANPLMNYKKEVVIGYGNYILFGKPFKIILIV